MAVIDPLNGREWDQLVLSHPEVTFFHSSAWAMVLAKSYGHRPLYLHLHHGNSSAFVPLMEVKSHLTGSRGVCLPFSDFCGPLLSSDCEPGVVTEPLSTLALKCKWKYFEVRGMTGLDLMADSAAEYHGHILDLRKSADDLFAGFSSSVRRAIRKAEGSQLSVDISRSRESVTDFYRLHLLTRTRHGLPPQPLSFFHHIFEEVLQKELGFVVRASLKGRWIAAAIFFQFGRKGVYKFGASEAASRATRANNLVMWKGICFLAHSGCESLHFGRTSLGNGGLRKFKLGWGTTEELIKYFQWETKAGKWARRRDRSKGLHNSFFANMPLTVNRLAGNFLYPHLD